MKRHELEHIIRAAGAIAGSGSVYVIGSQAILGQFADPPESLVVSQEADIWPADDPRKSDLIDGTIGELSPFHELFGYYAHGIGEETAVLPTRWKERTVVLCNENTSGYRGLCLHPVDIAISKLAAGREKDIEYVKVLVQNGMVSSLLMHTVIEAELLPARREEVRRVLDQIVPSHPDA